MFRLRASAAGSWIRVAWAAPAPEATMPAWPMVRLGLTVVLAATAVLGLLPAPNALDDTHVPGWAWLLSAILLAALCGGWWRWWWRGRGARAALVVVSCAAVMLTLPAGLSDFVAVVAMMVGSAMLALSGRARWALGIITLACLAGFVITTHSNGWYAGAIDGTVSFVVFAGLAGFGALFGGLEQARALAVARGAELSGVNARLRATMAMERDLVLAQERARTARELHAGLSRGLTEVASSIASARAARREQPERAWAAVERAAARNTEALETMRLWARALDPPRTAYGIGGAAAFEDVVDAFRGTGLDVRVSHHGSAESLPGPVGVFATRLIQEGLTNVLRHARARRVDIAIVQSPHQVRIAVRDDGVGVAEPVEGFGLRSLRERAESLGGTLVVGRRGSAGSEIAAVLPLEWEG